MQVKFKRVWGKKLTDEQKEVLNNYEVISDFNGFYIIELKSVKEIFYIAENLECELIVSNYGKTLEIYDGYIE